MVVLGLGYRPVEYELYGVDFHRRGRIADEKLARLLGLLDTSSTGTTRYGSPRHRSPRPGRPWPGVAGPPPRPSAPAAMGSGSSHRPTLPASRRSTRPRREAPGTTRVSASFPPPRRPTRCSSPTTRTPAGTTSVRPSSRTPRPTTSGTQPQERPTPPRASRPTKTVGALRDAAGAHRVVTPTAARSLIAEHGLLALHPLCGGLEPDVAWPYLERAVAAATS